ncbi:MAG: hypothetical protein RL404_1330 [Pseudomonadota bacterium]|jgi:type III secretion protein J
MKHLARQLLTVLVAGFLAMLVAACGSRVELLKDVSEAEANEALAVLLQAGIGAGKLPGKEGVVSLDVEQSQVARAITILNSEGLPHERYAKMGDVFRKEGLISSPLEERARYLWALSQELSATVSQIDGVIKARVHVVLPERSSGGDPPMPSSAAVFIKHKAGYNLDDAIPQVKRLVSNSIPGLSADKVTVVMLAASPKPPESAGGPVPSMLGTISADGKPANPYMIWGGCALVLALLALLGFFAWMRWGKLMGSSNKPTPAASTGGG